MSNFDRAILDVLKHEGGYVNDPADRGGATNFGLSQRTYPMIDMKQLTRDDAIAIYRRDFWQKRYDEMPYQIAAKTFDMAVNMGIGQAHKLLQRAVGAVDDGIIGPKTLAMIDGMDADDVLRRITAEQKKFYAAVVHNRPTSSVFMAGWTHRAEYHPAA